MLTKEKLLSSDFSAGFCPLAAANAQGIGYQVEVAPTLRSGGGATSRMGTGGNNTPMVMEEQKYENLVVRRLTPLECERLQGFPDGWTDIGEWVDSKGKVHKPSDTPRYKALGNSIALPFWEWLAHRMVDQLRKDGVEEPKMASLFDGISGFPLVYSRCGCEPVWASEIEEFPIAVTKKRFPEPEEEGGNEE